MKRRTFASLAAVTVLSGCTTSVGGPDDDAQTGAATTSSDPSALPGLDDDGVADVDAFLDAQQTVVGETSHAFSFTHAAEDGFEDGFETGELRAQYDPGSGRLLVRRWWEYPDGDRSQQTQIYTDGSEAVQRRGASDQNDDARYERLSPSAARARYTDFWETLRSFLRNLTYGSPEPVSADGDDTDNAAHRLPVEGVRDTDDGPLFHAVDGGTLLLSNDGLVVDADLDGLVERREDGRTLDLEFALTAVGDTTVSEPAWFDDVPETTTTPDGGDGTGGDADSTETSATRTTDRTTVDAGPNTVVVGPNGDLVFDPETLRVEPGTTVRWVWASDHHNLEPKEQPPGADWNGHPGISEEGTEHTHTFSVEGTYTYVCEPHVAAGMEAEIVVE